QLARVRERGRGCARGEQRQQCWQGWFHRDGLLERKPGEQEQSVVVAGGAAASVIIVAPAVELAIARVLDAEARIGPRSRRGILLAPRYIFELKRVATAVRRSIGAAFSVGRCVETGVARSGSGEQP